MARGFSGVLRREVVVGRVTLTVERLACFFWEDFLMTCKGPKQSLKSKKQDQ